MHRSIWPRNHCAASAAAAASAGVVNAGAATDKRAADAKARVQHITPSEPKVDAACRSRCVALGRATRVAPAAAQPLLRQRQRRRQRLRQQQHQALSLSLSKVAQLGLPVCESASNGAQAEGQRGRQERWVEGGRGRRGLWGVAANMARADDDDGQSMGRTRVCDARVSASHICGEKSRV